MNKTKISLTALIVSVLLFNLAGVQSASAAMPPKQFPDKGNCVAALSATHVENKKTVNDYTKRELLTYLEGRVKIRESKLAGVDSLLNTTRANYNYYNSKVPVVHAAIDAVNAKKTESLDGLSPVASLEFGHGSIPGRTLDMNGFEISYGNARNVIGNARNVVNGGEGSTRANIIEAACASIFDAQVFSGVVPIAKRSYIQSRIDILNLMNSGLNVSRQNAVASVYIAKQKSDPAFDEDKAIIGSVGWASNPIAEQDTLAGLAGQAGGDAVALNGQLNQIADTIKSKNDDIGAVFVDVMGAQVEKKQPTD